MPVDRTAADVTIRRLEARDRAAVTRIDALHTGARKTAYWRRVFARFVAGDESDGRVGLAAVAGRTVLGYLLGEVRAFEFGSEACGWIFAVGVSPDHARAGVASVLLEEARRRFAALGVPTVRTMVRVSDVGVLSFFRARGFVGGPFVQLELDLEEQA